MNSYFLVLAITLSIAAPSRISGQDSVTVTTVFDSISQRAAFEDLGREGTAVYLNGESAEIKKLQKATKKEFAAWGYWNIVSDPKDADYVMQVIGMRTGMDVFAYATVRVQGIIHDKSGRILWTSAMYKGESNGLTGFNPLADALGKLIKRGIEPEFGIKW